MSAEGEITGYRIKPLIFVNVPCCPHAQGGKATDADWWISEPFEISGKRMLTVMDFPGIGFLN